MVKKLVIGMASGLLLSFVVVGDIKNQAPVVKPTQKDTADYYIIGKTEDFQFLQGLITDPDSYSNNQRKAAMNWINTRRKIEAKKP